MNIFLTSREKSNVKETAKDYFAIGTGRIPFTGRWGPAAFVANVLLPNGMGPNYITALALPAAITLFPQTYGTMKSGFLFAATYLFVHRVGQHYAKRVRSISGTGAVLSELQNMQASMHILGGSVSPHLLAVFAMCLPQRSFVRIPRSAALLGISLGARYIAQPIASFFFMGYIFPPFFQEVIGRLASSCVAFVLRGDLIAAAAYAIAPVEAVPFITSMQCVARLSGTGTSHPSMLFLIASQWYYPDLQKIVGSFCDLKSLVLLGVVTEMAFGERCGNGFLTNRRVYIDGVYDLCHAGHKKAMERAAQHGTTLICGIMGDEDTLKYKRAPIMTEDERATEVLGCKFVDEVIIRAPAFGLTEEFLKEHDIHVVCYGEEYDVPTDKYYAAARAYCETRVLPRTHGVSTTDLVKRIRGRADLDAPPKDAAKKQ